MNRQTVRPALARRNRGGTLLGIFIGLLIGVLISFGIVWTMNKSSLPFRDKGVRVDRSVNGANGNGEVAGTPAPLPGKPGDRAGVTGDKPRFEFYKILPGNQEAVPAPAPDAKTGRADARPDAKAAGAGKPAGEPLYLQVGAFQKPADADNLKSRLALMGFDAGVQEVEVPDKGKLYRVRAGPFPSVDEMNRARQQLSDNGVQVAGVKGR
jgi:cell division protein FtsN